MDASPGMIARPVREGRLLRWAVRALALTSWISGAIFAAYILAFYIGAVAAGTPDDWNEVLPRLHERGSGAAANLGMGVHFALGAVLLLLGPVQLVESVRRRAPRVHRWIGWTYATSAALTGLGGLAFIALRGGTTVGGATMSFGFALYGALMVLAAVMAVRHAMARNLVVHRAWAIRLYALVIGSWLYRMDYGFWFLFTDGLGHTEDFTGWFDKVMVFWFYVPNLAVAELAIRAGGWRPGGLARGLAIAVLAGTTAFLALATYSFTDGLWGPTIVERLAG